MAAHDRGDRAVPARGDRARALLRLGDDLDAEREGRALDAEQHRADVAALEKCVQSGEAQSSETGRRPQVSRGSTSHTLAQRWRVDGWLAVCIRIGALSPVVMAPTGSLSRPLPPPIVGEHDAGGAE